MLAKEEMRARKNIREKKKTQKRKDAHKNFPVIKKKFGYIIK